MDVLQHFEIGLRVLGLEVYDLGANRRCPKREDRRGSKNRYAAFQARRRDLQFQWEPNPQSCSPPQCTELGAGACRQRIRCGASLCEWKRDAEFRGATGDPERNQSGPAPAPKSL